MFKVSGVSRYFALFFGLSSALVSVSANAWSGDKDDCGIWLCLPTGFAGDCGGPRKKFIDRITHKPKPKPPMPSWGSCIIRGKDSRVFSEARNVGIESAKKAGINKDGYNDNLNDHLDNVSIELKENQPYSYHYEYTTYSKMLNDREIKKAEHGKIYPSFDAWGGLAGLYYDSNGSIYHRSFKDGYKRLVGHYATTIKIVFNTGGLEVNSAKVKEAIEKVRGISPNAIPRNIKGFSDYEELKKQHRGINPSDLCKGTNYSSRICTYAKK